MDREALIHFIGGAVGGTAGTAVTCPLEVIKTRMQSSRGIVVQPETGGGGPSTSRGGPPSSSDTSKKGPESSAYSRHGARPQPLRPILGNPAQLLLAQQVKGGELSLRGMTLLRLCSSMSEQEQKAKRRGLSRIGIISHIQNIVKREGVSALYKGLVPNLIGVAPAKAVYFYTYSTSKRFWNAADVFVPNSAIVHMVSAGTAGFVGATVVNPIWLVKTRLQLYQGKMTILDMVRRVYQREGVRGFYRGVTASYAGISETMIQFVLYEHLRGMLLHENANGDEDRRKMDILNFMVAGGSAKFIACVIAYPHEVVRTRLREESDGQRRGFFGTLLQLYKEGGRAMYRGLSVQLLRAVPSTAITMTTYETVVYMLHQL